MPHLTSLFDKHPSYVHHDAAIRHFCQNTD